MQCVFVSSGLLKIDNIAAGVGVVIFSPASGVAVGMHILRAIPPSSTVSNPTYFAATAIPYAVAEIKKREMIPPFSVAIAGGGSMMPSTKGDVGEKMSTVVKKVLEKTGLAIKIEKTGGSRVRTIILNLDEGKINILHK